MRNKLINAINNSDLNLGLLYEFYLSKGGTDIPIRMFQAYMDKFLMFYPKPLKVETVYKELLREYKVNLMFDQDKNLIKAY